MEGDHEPQVRRRRISLAFAPTFRHPSYCNEIVFFSKGNQCSKIECFQQLSYLVEMVAIPSLYHDDEQSFIEMLNSAFKDYLMVKVKH